MLEGRAGYWVAVRGYKEEMTIVPLHERYEMTTMINCRTLEVDGDRRNG